MEKNLAAHTVILFLEHTIGNDLRNTTAASKMDAPLWKTTAGCTTRLELAYLAYTIWTWQEKFKKNNQFLSEKRAEKWWANLQDP